MPVTSIAHLDQCVASYLTGVMLLAHRNEPDAPKAPRRRFRTLRIAWSVGWGVVAVLFVALWIRSYWWATNLENMTIGSRTLQCALVNGRIFVRSKPADHMQRVSLFQNYHKLDPEFYYWNQPSKSAFDFALNEFYTPGSIFFSFPYWFAFLICGAFAAAPWLPYRFSLGTLLIATTLVAVVLGLIVGLRWMPSGGFFMRRMIYFVAVSLAALVRPSTYWTLAMLATVTLICLFGIYRAVASSRGRSLWASFIAGLMAYWLVVVFVRELGSNEWSTYLSAASVAINTWRRFVVLRDQWILKQRFG